jgi:hypothetical protein
MSIERINPTLLFNTHDTTQSYADKLDDLINLQKEIHKCNEKIISKLREINSLSDGELHNIRTILFKLFEENMKLDTHSYSDTHLNQYFEHINTYLYVLLTDYRSFDTYKNNRRIIQKLNTEILDKEKNIDNKSFKKLLSEEIINIYDVFTSRILGITMSVELMNNTEIYFSKILEELKKIFPSISHKTTGGFKVKRIRVIRKY